MSYFDIRISFGQLSPIQKKLIFYFNMLALVETAQVQTSTTLSFLYLVLDCET